MLRRILAYTAVAVVMATPSAAAGVARYPYDGTGTDQSITSKALVFYGDSVQGQAGPVVETLGEQRAHTVVIHALSGGAPCNAVTGQPLNIPGHMGNTGATYVDTVGAFTVSNGRHADAVSFAYVGNANTQCMLDELGWTSMPGVLTQVQVDQIVAVYRTDLLIMIDYNLAHGIVSWLVGPPRMHSGTWHGQLNDELEAMYTDLALMGGVGMNNGPRNLLSYDAYHETLSLNGVAETVRYTDGTHLELPYGQWMYAMGELMPLITPTP